VTDAVVTCWLRKTFPRRAQEGCDLRSFVKRHRKDVNGRGPFRIDPGEVVGFLGPNGAGRLTLKILSGCFTRRAGARPGYGRGGARTPMKSMTLLMGNRTQLVWDIPAADGFRVAGVYRIPKSSSTRTVNSSPGSSSSGLVHKPVRNLSLSGV
jgi:ABC-2 type transport system ATP-binding protein